MFIVVTKTTFDPAARDQVLSLVRDSLPIFRKQPGLLELRPLVAGDETHTLTYLAWETEQHHERCMTSPDFERINPRWQQLFGSGRAKFELATYNLFDVDVR